MPDKTRKQQSFEYGAIILLCSTMIVKLIGAIFKIPLFRMNLIDAINLLKENNIKIYGTSLKSAISVTTVDKKSKLAFVLGNEANGVSEDVLNACDQNIIIPLDNNVESLNVGIAGAILMWELKK